MKVQTMLSARVIKRLSTQGKYVKRQHFHVGEFDPSSLSSGDTLTVDTRW